MNPLRTPIRIVRNALTQGMAPGRVALCIAVGGVLGVFPILGATTILNAAAATALRLNHVLIQAVNYAVYPLQLALIGVFYATGGWLLEGGQGPVSLSGLLELLRADPAGGLRVFVQLSAGAVLAWLLTSPVLAAALYGLARAAVDRIGAALTARRSDCSPACPA